MGLGHRDPELFLRRFTYGYTATLFTRLISELSGHKYEPLDYDSFQTTFDCRNFQDFNDKLRRTKKYKGFATSPDLRIKDSDEHPVCIIEVSRRNGIFNFSYERKFELNGLIFKNGPALSFDLWLESFNVGLSSLDGSNPTDLDNAYDKLWSNIVNITKKEKISIDDVTALSKIVFSRHRKYAEPQIFNTFFINESKLDNTWYPKLEECRNQFGRDFQIYYLLWMDDLHSGFNYCTLDDIENNKGEPQKNRFNERFYQIPFTVLKPMWEFPLIRIKLIL